MNKLILVGNITKDPELSKTPNGASVCHFSLAVPRPYTQGKDEEKTDFFNCTVWKNSAEFVAKYKKKGDKIALEGYVQMRTYEDNSGVKRTAIDVIGVNVE